MTKLFQLVTNKFHRLSEKSWAQGLFFGTILTIIFLYPIIAKATTHLPSKDDGAFIAWTIQWVGRALLSGKNIYNAPIFYSYKNTLAFSDPFVTSGVLNIVFNFFTQNLVLQSNLHLLLGTITCFAGMYILVAHLTNQKVAAFASALFFTFSSLHLQYLVHLHTYLVAGIPLAIYFYLRWLKDQRSYWLLLCCTTFLLQTLNSPMTGFFSAACLLPIILQKQSWRVITKHPVVIASLLVCTISILGLFYLPYFQVAHQFQYTRSIRDAAAFAHSINVFFSGELLAIYLLLYIGRKYISKPFALITIIGAVLMLGPVLKVNGQTLKIFSLPIPLPYAILYYLVPGFKAFRASSRWITVFNVGLSLLLGTTLAKLPISTRLKLFFAIFLVIFLWLTQIPQLQLYQIHTHVPDIYTVVHQQPQQTLAEFPVYMWGMNPYVSHENERLLYQAVHQKILYNGASGFTPPDREQTWLTLSQHLPSNDVLTHLRDNRIQLLLVHFDEYEQLAHDHYAPLNTPYPNAAILKQLIATQPQLHELSCDNSACLYTIEP